MLLDWLQQDFRSPAECMVKVGEGRTPIEDLYPFLKEVVVETSRDKPFVATLTFDTRRDEFGKWVVQDSPEIFPWQRIWIEVAFGEHEEEVMRGYIREVKADYPEDAATTTVKLECQDDSIFLDRTQVRKEWGAEQPTADGLVVEEIVRGYPGLAMHMESAMGLDGLVVLQDKTDAGFLRDRAEASGYELIFEKGEVYFGPMRLEADPQKTVMVYAGADTHCYRFSIQDDGHKPDMVAFDKAAENGDQTEREVVEPDLPLLGLEPARSVGQGPDFVWVMEGQGGKTPEEMRTLAQRKANERSMKVSAEGELDGSLYGRVLRVGHPVGIDGVGEKYNGTYYVDTVRHVFNHEGYRQAFTLMRNAYGDNLESSVDTLLGVL